MKRHPCWCPFVFSTSPVTHDEHKTTRLLVWFRIWRLSFLGRHGRTRCAHILILLNFLWLQFRWQGRGGITSSSLSLFCGNGGSDNDDGVVQPTSSFSPFNDNDDGVVQPTSSFTPFNDDDDGVVQPTLSCSTMMTTKCIEPPSPFDDKDDDEVVQRWVNPPRCTMSITAIPHMPRTKPQQLLVWLCPQHFSYNLWTDWGPNHINVVVFVLSVFLYALHKLTHLHWCCFHFLYI